MVLARLCPILTPVLKSSTVVMWPIQVLWSYIGGWCLEIFSNLSSKGLADSPTSSS